MRSIAVAVQTTPNTAIDVSATAEGMCCGDVAIAGISRTMLAIRRLAAMGPIESRSLRWRWMIRGPAA
jgi:hypothetical protein